MDRKSPGIRRNCLNDHRHHQHGTGMCRVYATYDDHDIIANHDNHDITDDHDNYGTYDHDNDGTDDNYDILDICTSWNSTSDTCIR